MTALTATAPHVLPPATNRLSPADLEEMQRICWFHRIQLDEGVVTPGLDSTPEKLQTICLPANLAGKSVLDIGAWDGFFSFEAERRGARRVVACDSQVWKVPQIGKHGFNFAKRILNSQVESVELEVLDIGPEKIGTFDVVLFLGVLYHLPNPVQALQKVASVVGEMLILETHVDLLDVPRPAIAFYPGDELNNDISNWCGPNGPALEGMLKAVGFQRTSIVYESIENYPLRDAKPGTYGRMVVHAWWK
ncbi:MAG: DUF1698 domain-containing protein [Pirellulales bacterium]|nr:DUF1698 domain-containing protein [Pirellulales bacterium]